MGNKSSKKKCAINGCSKKHKHESPLCSEHECEYAKCHEVKIYKKIISAESKYCEIHTCENEKCTNITKTNKHCCEPHTCNIRNCENKKTKFSGVCEAHTCIVPQCFKEMDSKSEYCNIHRCSVTDCIYIKINNLTRCMHHTCKKPDCHNKKRIGENYCDTHVCKTKHCDKLNMKNYSSGFRIRRRTREVSRRSTTINSDFCKECKCKEKYCVNRKVGYLYCTKHKHLEPKPPSYKLDEEEIIDGYYSYYSEE